MRRCPPELLEMTSWAEQLNNHPTIQEMERQGKDIEVIVERKKDGE